MSSPKNLHTPKNDSLRKTAIVRSAGRSKRQLFNIDKSLLLPEVDDELEQPIPRHSRSNPTTSVQRHSSSISLPQSPTIANDEMKAHFQFCLKLFAENKISLNNAWNLKIIDYMRVILQSHTVATKSLQVASASLDTSARIYGIRVDDIHSSGLKLASTMTRVESQNERVNKDQDQNVQDHQGRKRRKRSQNRVQKSTIVKDPKSLIDKTVKYDSNFLRITKNLPMSSTSELLTKKLPMNYGGYTLILPNRPHVWPTYSKKDPNINYEKIYPINLPSINGIQLIPAFSNFVIDEWDPTEEDHFLSDESSYQEGKNYDENEIPQPHLDGSVQEEINYDENGIPQPHLDGPIQDLFENETDYQSSLEENQDNPINTNVVSFIDDGRRMRNNVGRNEYSFMDSIKVTDTKFITRIWAGPNHWKFKVINQRPAICAGKVKKNKRIKKNEIQPMNFDQPSGIDKNKLNKINNYYISSKPSRITFFPHDITKLNNKRPSMLKPNTHLEVQFDNDENNDESNHQENFTNSPDGSQYEANDDNDSMNVEEQLADALQPVQDFRGDNLIVQPELVEAIDLPHASKAKKMNIKKLKDAVCKIVLDKETKAIKTPNFSTVYTEIPKHISKSMRRELSVHLAFVSLLHVGNENNLFFKQCPDINDIVIEKGE